jgi:hypothetical protein
LRQLLKIKAMKLIWLKRENLESLKWVPVDVAAMEQLSIKK